jgi:16S rRNA (guanine966-N2)-methyltransferase
MRIIAGKYRGRRLQSPPSLNTRPTSDRLRETLFNILAPRIDGAVLLDLCAGSGAVGIEALSRGASHVTFVDQSRKMTALIEANLETLDAGETNTGIFASEASAFLRKHEKNSAPRFDIIFFDPPYASDYESVLNYLGSHAGAMLSEEGIVVVEHASKKILADQFNSLERYRRLKQGDSALSFYRAEA